jgi:hypothetical protein
MMSKFMTYIKPRENATAPLAPRLNFGTFNILVAVMVERISTMSSDSKDRLGTCHAQDIP